MLSHFHLPAHDRSHDRISDNSHNLVMFGTPAKSKIPLSDWLAAYQQHKVVCSLCKKHLPAPLDVVWFLYDGRHISCHCEASESKDEIF